MLGIMQNIILKDKNLNSETEENLDMVLNSQNYTF